MPKPGTTAGGKITREKRVSIIGKYEGLPDTDTEVEHRLGTEPEFVTLTTLGTGVDGYGICVAKSSTSITIRGNTSGVNVEYKLET